VNSPPPESELSRLLDVALEMPPGERVAWVDTLDAHHDALKPRLRALLARGAEIESRDFLGSLPTLDEEAEELPAETASASDAVGMRIGPYRLERQLGAGGMGTVWLASRADGLFERQVALKLPHRGMFGADLAERMARERSILAGLEHPHIARLYEAGLTEDGQPFLALEFVEGQSIDAWCREHGSDLRSRLQLMIQVADAVAAAHARLVVHRDLKPANIHVTREGYVRLLDFGIAKLLDAPADGAAGLTQLSVHALTPDYASPEQILGETVTTASDVYSLGVVLYELLTSERPYRLRRDTRGALEDAIVQAEPRRPSEVAGPFARALRGDLDTILLKALRKKPAERYATVNAFADDLRNHLAGRPVQARPDSAWYRASRFMRRNRLAVGATAVVALALIVAAVGTSVGLVRARVAEQRALAEAETTRQVSRFMVDLFKVTDPGEARGNTITAREILDKAAVRVEGELSTAPGTRAELLATMADVYSKLGLYAEGARLASQALALRRANVPGSRELADTLDLVGHIDSLLSKGKEAEPLHREALAIRRAMQPVDHAAVARTLSHIGTARYSAMSLDAALPMFLEAREELRRVASPDPEQLGELLSVTGNVYHESGKFQDAIPLYREALETFRKALGADHPQTATALGYLAAALKDTRQFAEAEQAYLQSLASLRKTLGATHPVVANTLNNIAVLYMEQRRFDDALAAARESATIYRATLGDEHDKTNIARLTAARAELLLDHPQVAEKEIREILAVRRRTLAPDNLHLGQTLQALATALNDQERFTEAEPFAREAGEVVQRAVGPDHWRLAAVNRTLGNSLAGQKRYAEAEPVFIASYELLSRTRGPEHRSTRESLQGLINLYDKWGKPERAAAMQAQLARK